MSALAKLLEKQSSGESGGNNGERRGEWNASRNYSGNSGSGGRFWRPRERNGNESYSGDGGKNNVGPNGGRNGGRNGSYREGYNRGYNRSYKGSRSSNDVRQEFIARQNQDRPRKTNSRWAAEEPPEPDCFGTFCQCSSSVQKSCYPCRRNADHTVRLATLPKRLSLIGHHGQFCGGFYHTAPSAEAGNPALCVGEGCIKSPTCVLVVRVTVNENIEYIARYTNCYRGYENSVHAEQFMMADEALKKVLEQDDTKLKQVDMFITQQPCHHSSGRVENKHVSGNTSCTNRLLEWSRNYLCERNVSLMIKLSRIFRAHWEDDDVHETAEDAEVFGSRAKMAKEGLILLMNETNINVEMLNEKDWHFLLSLSDQYVYNGGKRIGTEVLQEPKVTNEMIQHRLDGDVWFGEFLKRLMSEK